MCATDPILSLKELCTSFNFTLTTPFLDAVHQSRDPDIFSTSKHMRTESGQRKRKETDLQGFRGSVQDLEHLIRLQSYVHDIITLRTTTNSHFLSIAKNAFQKAERVLASSPGLRRKDGGLVDTARVLVRMCQIILRRRCGYASSD